MIKDINNSENSDFMENKEKDKKEAQDKSSAELIAEEEKYQKTYDLMMDQHYNYEDNIKKAGLKLDKELIELKRRMTGRIGDDRKAAFFAQDFQQASEQLHQLDDLRIQMRIESVFLWWDLRGLEGYDQNKNADPLSKENFLDHLPELSENLKEIRLLTDEQLEFLLDENKTGIDFINSLLPDEANYIFAPKKIEKHIDDKGKLIYTLKLEERLPDQTEQLKEFSKDEIEEFRAMLITEHRKFDDYLSNIPEEHQMKGILKEVKSEFTEIEIENFLHNQFAAHFMDMDRVNILRAYLQFIKQEFLKNPPFPEVQPDSKFSDQKILEFRQHLVKQELGDLRKQLQVTELEKMDFLETASFLLNQNPDQTTSSSERIEEFRQETSDNQEISTEELGEVLKNMQERDAEIKERESSVLRIEPVTKGLGFDLAKFKSQPPATIYTPKVTQKRTVHKAGVKPPVGRPKKTGFK